MRASLALGVFLCAASPAWLRAADQFAAAAQYSGQRGENSLLVWQNGRTLFERGPADPSRPPRVFSVTKSLVAIGVLRDWGGFSLDQPVAFPAAQGIPLADLMNQVSGLPPSDEEFYSAGLDDKRPVLAKLRRGAPGFAYGPSHWEVLGEEIARAAGGNIDRWLRRYVPGVGARALALWRRDSKGRLFFSTGARMGARELLPAAKAVLEGTRPGGNWPAAAKLLLASGTPSNPMYALGFWLNRAAGPAAREIDVEASIGRPRPSSFWRGGCLGSGAPRDLLAMIGSRGQRVYIVPSEKMVVVRLGTGAGFSDAEFLRRLFAR